ncbi:LysR family transcriptional regulator [Paraglaciecola sp. L3A3]|uniref:LysR family transcriptional regulator n=1 Tax=Paraglaciecola sp. L3A3 TaxID=2686358 RepID=UPI00131E42A7|nr:LysR family transcriptional regulator [Paraglaciecola sp. L3A3]
MINQTWLKTFCTLADIGHFTQTAEKLFMTQSGVSQHIKKLEKQLDCQLLVREGKSFSLTNKGQELKQKGQVLLRNAEKLEALIKQDDPYKGIIKIASPGSVGLSLYPKLLTLQQTHPDLCIDYAFAPNNRIEQDLVDNQLDLGLITQLSNKSDLVCEKVAEEPLVLVTPATVKSISWQGLLTLGFIAHPDAAQHGKQLLRANFPQFEHVEQFQHKGFSNQISLILEPVSKGLGFTVLPLFAASAYHAQQSIQIHNLPIPVSENLYLCVNRHVVNASRAKIIQSKISDFLA